MIVWITRWPWNGTLCTTFFFGLFTGVSWWGQEYGVTGTWMKCECATVVEFYRRGNTEVGPTLRRICSQLLLCQLKSHMVCSGIERVPLREKETLYGRRIPQHILFTYLLPYCMELRSFWEADSSSANQDIPRKFITTFINPPPVSILSQIDPMNALQTSCRKSILILSSHLRLDLPSGLSFLTCSEKNPPTYVLHALSLSIILIWSPE
jgi:hypothetical protein